MNRIGFMTQLAALLQDISVEERKEAMQYYNDYFDDAGEDNETQVIEELESPQKVAATIKAGLAGADTNHGEFTESGYSDARFERKESPAKKEAYYYEDSEQQARSNNTTKIILIIVLILFGIPVILPIGIAIAVLVIAAVVTVFALFVALVLVSVALVISGVSLFCVGIMNLVPAVAIGLALMGTGLILTVIGIVASIGSVKLCTVAFPGIMRGIVWLCRRPFQGRAVA